MSGVELPPQIQEQMQRFQQMQQTLQAVSSQKQQLEIQLVEANKAIEELEKSPTDAPIYKMVGSIMVKSQKEGLLKDLKERKEILNTRVSILGKQEERAKTKLKEMQEKLQQQLRPQGPSTQ